MQPMQPQRNAAFVGETIGGPGRSVWWQPGPPAERPPYAERLGRPAPHISASLTRYLRVNPWRSTYLTVDALHCPASRGRPFAVSRHNHVIVDDSVASGPHAHSTASCFSPSTKSMSVLSSARGRRAGAADRFASCEVATTAPRYGAITRTRCPCRVPTPQAMVGAQDQSPCEQSSRVEQDAPSEHSRGSAAPPGTATCG
jgi:hypothetical protein